MVCVSILGLQFCIRWAGFSQALDELSWDDLEFFCARFPHGDKWGLLLACISMLPFFLGVAHIALACYLMILLRLRIIRLLDLHMVTFLAGTIANLALSVFLQRYLCELRPPAPYREGKLEYCPYGMPSNHAQVMAFFATYLHLYVLLELPDHGTHWERFLKVFFVFFVSVLTGLVLYSRVYLLYHSPEQVLYGLLLGFLSGFCWFDLTQVIFRPHFVDPRQWVRNLATDLAADEAGELAPEDAPPFA